MKNKCATILRNLLASLFKLLKRNLKKEKRKKKKGKGFWESNLMHVGIVYVAD